MLQDYLMSTHQPYRACFIKNSTEHSETRLGFKFLKCTFCSIAPRTKRPKETSLNSYGVASSSLSALSVPLHLAPLQQKDGVYLTLTLDEAL